jgi:hypothetical protein
MLDPYPDPHGNQCESERLFLRVIDSMELNREYRYCTYLLVDLMIENPRIQFSKRVHVRK